MRREKKNVGLFRRSGVVRVGIRRWERTASPICRSPSPAGETKEHIIIPLVIIMEEQMEVVLYLVGRLRVTAPEDFFSFYDLKAWSVRGAGNHFTLVR